MLAISNDVARHTFGRGNQLAIHNEETMVESLEKRLNDDCPTMLGRSFEGGLYLRMRFQID